ncbi:LuxR C-terminal-related transcriptional regulator [Kitasatospora sp. NPDC093102]|uniref:LuxR C-terminal-related transcriptional regulator n=1 Tax=Kitasatospora sp. NPDC093102 TaxID=3155069 RepID=UPI00341BA7E8
MTTPPTADSPTPERHRKRAHAAAEAGCPPRKLTPREAQTLAHLVAGHDLPRTAAALGVTPTTARSYRRRALRKLGTRTEAEALALLGGTLPHPSGPGPTGHPANCADLDPAGPVPASAAPGPVPAAPAAAGKPAPGASDGTRRAARDARVRVAARPARAVNGGAGPGTPAEKPRQAAGTPPSTGKCAAPGRAQDQRTPVDQPEHVTTPPVCQAAPAAGDGQRRPSDASREPVAPAGPEQARPESTANAGGGSGPAAPAAAAAGSGDTPPRTAAAQGADGRHTQAAGPDRARKARPAQEERHTTAAPAAHAQDPAGRESATPPPVGPGRAALAAAAPAGADDDLDAEPPAVSFEELYETAHTRLVQQVFLLTACRYRAVRCVRRAFGEARRRWGAAVASGSPEGWVRVRACELALSPWHRGRPRWAHVWRLPHRRIKVRPADEAQAVLPDHDRLTDGDRALLKALKQLSRPQRRALVLHDGLGLPAAAVSVEVESTRAAAEGRVWAARTALAQWVPELVGPDPAAPGFADGLSGLLYRAAVRGCPEPHRTPVPVLRARHRLLTASRTGAAALLTVAVGGATLATLTGVRPAALFRSTTPPTPALCLPATGERAAEPGVPLVPGGAPNGITSIWCSPAPGREAVLVEPHPQAAARWRLPTAGRIGAPPPQGPMACRPWSPLPCTTGPSGR